MDYIINKNSKLDTDCHKIHLISCKRKPQDKNIIKLEECICPMDAVIKAKECYCNVEFCKYCCKHLLSYNKISA